MTLWHRILHLFSWNNGVIETWWEGEQLMVGFRCECGELSGVDKISEDIWEKTMKTKVIGQCKRGGETIPNLCRKISIWLGIATLIATAILIWSVYGCGYQCVRVFPFNQ